MNTPHTTDDPLFLRYELATAFADYAGAPSPATALAVAAVLGQTRLFGVDPGPELDGRLPPALAAAAVDGLEAALPGWAEAVQKLDAGYDGEWRTDGDEDCSRLLEDRMRTWGALVAVREAADERPELGPLVERARAVGEAFDRWLRSQEEELSAVVGLPLLSNWKGLLAPPYRDPLPWWLDGTLEAAAARVRQTALAAMPSEAVWRLVANKAILPPLVEPAVAAALGARESVYARKRELWWASPDERRTARLILPAVSTKSEESVPRPINFDAVPTDTPVLVGNAAGTTSASGQFRVSLAQLRDADLRLKVGGEWWSLTDEPQSKEKESL
jgi:hypothetical protein